ncbi:MAG: hypothetical protein ABIY55_13985 [Kofleriaceae bacterium]
MSEPALTKTRPEDEHAQALRTGGAPAEEHSYRPNYLVAGKQIDDILNGTGSPAELPQLVSFLTNDAVKAKYLKDLKRFEKVPGDIALDCAVGLGADGNAALTTARHGTPPATPTGLRRYLEARTAKELANLDHATVESLRGLLTGSLATAVPSILATLQSFATNGEILRWFVETTPDRICANAFGNNLTIEMAATLDREKLWSWVDAMQATEVGAGMAEAIPKIVDGHAKTRLTTLANGRAGMGQDAFYAERDTQTASLHDELKRGAKSTLQSLLDAAGRSLQLGQDSDRPKLMAELARLKPSADDVLAFAPLSGLSQDDMFTLLLHASGVTADHVIAYLSRSSGVSMLASAKTRTAVRAIAPELKLQDLLASLGDSMHDTVLENPGLRAWFLESATPHDLFWLCTTNRANAGKATRLVQAEAGFAWVHKLPALPRYYDDQMRILALNCHHAATAKYIQEFLLGQAKFDDKVADRGAKPTDLRSHSGEDQRLVDAEGDLGTAEEVMLRLADLDEATRAKLGQDDAKVAAIADKLTGEQFARAARYLDLTFARTIAHSPRRSSQTVVYLDGRSHAEQLAALAKPALVKQAASSVHPNLLVVFSALSEPTQLAAALTRDPGLLELLLAGSDPSRVASLTGVEPVRAVVEGILAKGPALVKKLPHYADLSADGKHGVDELDAGAAEHSKARHELDREKQHKLSGEPDARRQGHRLGGAREAKTLVEAIDTLGGQHDRAATAIGNAHDYFGEKTARAAEQHLAETNALAILAEHKSEVPALLSDRTLHSSVGKLAAATDLPPDLAVPWIDAAELARMPNAMTWWMTYADPLVLLHRLDGNPKALLLLAGGLNTGTMGASAWLDRLPKGFELDRSEDRVIEQLRPLLRDSAALRSLFLSRFGMPAPGEYSVKELGDLWSVIGRLPANHLKQERISSFNKAAIAPAAGQYVPGDHRIDIGDGEQLGKCQLEFYSEANEAWYSRAQLAKTYGYDEARIDLLSSQGRFHTRVVGADLEYQLVPQKIDQFTQVVLHEVGHSVDDMIGGRTPPVWEFAGWHAYSDATFDQWAAEMGGWERVTSPDKEKIREAWIEAARGETSVKSLVDDTHPALADRYAKVGIVKAAREGKSLHHTERSQIGDRVFVAGSYVDSWYSVNASVAASAPSVYSLNAPMEYFAESYVEYYRGVDGSPGSQLKKGGALAGPVRTWFDENVDKLKYDPARFAGGATEQLHPPPQPATTTKPST